MTEDQYLLICLMEECDEVSQRCAKALRFTPEEIQPGTDHGLTNAQRISGEMADLMGVHAMLVHRGVLEPVMIGEIISKQEKVAKYMAYSKERGVLL